MSWLDSITNIFTPPNSVELPQVAMPSPSLYDPNTHLSPNYALKDLIKTTQSLSRPNLPDDPNHLSNLEYLAQFLEMIDREIGPVQILSAYRTKELQNALSSTGEPTSTGTSFHELGRGVDIYPTTMPIDEYFGRMLANETVKNQLAEVAYKPGQNSIHIGINVPNDVRQVKVLALNDQNVYGRLNTDQIASFIAPYMESFDEAMDYAAARLVTYNRTPLILALIAAVGGVAYLAFAGSKRTARNPRLRYVKFKRKPRPRKNRTSRVSKAIELLKLGRTPKYISQELSMPLSNVYKLHRRWIGGPIPKAKQQLEYTRTELLEKGVISIKKKKGKRTARNPRRSARLNPRLKQSHVYRVQDSKGIGPYRSRKSKGIFGKHDRKMRPHKRLPPDYDTGFSRAERAIFNRKMKTGFKSLDQLKRWFNDPEEWERMKKKGFAVYKVPVKYGFYSKKQVIFEPKSRGKKIK